MKSFNNYEEINRHYNAFWENEYLERCCLYLKTKCDNPYISENAGQKWADLDFRCKQVAYMEENTEFFAEGFPHVITDFGPGSLAEFVGGSYKWADDTVWYDTVQYITDFENLPKIELNKNSAVFTMAMDYTNRLMDMGIVPSVPDIGGITDVIAALRGTNDLLFDLYDYPDEIMALNEKLRPMWLESFNCFSATVLKKTGYTTSWMPVLSDKPYYPVQCDFSAMISPEMFDKFIMPELRYITENIPRSIYHLDGVDAIRHLDSILKLDNLNAIQWVPGAGKPDAGDEQWFELYHKIQSAGKGLVLYGIEADALENVVKKLSPKGLFISTHYCEDEKHAAELIECAVKR